MYVVKMKFILLLSLALFQCFSSCDANLKNIVCEGDVKEYQNYLRVLFDTDNDSLFDQKTTCQMNYLTAQFNQKKSYNIQVGLRMTDMINHDETDNDYLKINVGPANITLNPQNIEIKTDSDKDSCNAPIFEIEQSKDFSHQNIFYIKITFQNENLKVQFSKSRKMWTTCSKLFIKPILPRKLEFEAYSEFGINLDLLSILIDAKLAPWADKNSMNKIKSTEHQLEHAFESEKLFKNITQRKFTRLGSSVQWLWYYQWFITIVLIFIVIKYKMDNRRKMHLL